MMDDKFHLANVEAGDPLQFRDPGFDLFTDLKWLATLRDVTGSPYRVLFTAKDAAGCEVYLQRERDGRHHLGVNSPADVVMAPKSLYVAMKDDWTSPIVGGLAVLRASLNAPDIRFYRLVEVKEDEH